MKAGFRTSAQAAVLRAVHGHPGMTRAQAAAEIGIPSGFAAETVGRLVAAELIAERPAPATGRRGRPTAVLGAHPDGPLVAAAAIGQETWQVAAVELGGAMLAATVRAHDGDQGHVLGAVTAELERIRDRFGARVRAAAVAVPGTVAGSRLVLAPGLSWHEVDLSALWQHYEPGSEFVVGNDATLAGIAESRRAPGFGSGTLLYLHVADGIGGAVVEAGRAVMGATGAAGEFGHMPFGDPGRACRCGAKGCWNTSIDNEALARFLAPSIPGGLRHVLASARAGDPVALSAIRAMATSIGRGVAGLVNGMDPHLVVVGGLGPELLRLASDEITAAYHDGLMAFRVVPPPPIAPARLGADGPLLGAADEAFTKLLTDEGLLAWAARGGRLNGGAERRAPVTWPGVDDVAVLGELRYPDGLPDVGQAAVVAQHFPCFAAGRDPVKHRAEDQGVGPGPTIRAIPHISETLSASGVSGYAADRRKRPVARRMRSD